MRRIDHPLVLPALILAFGLLVLALPKLFPSAAGYAVVIDEFADEYVCPPCGCGKDDEVHDKPGFCSVCGMAFVKRGSVQSQPVRPQAARKKVAILIFDGVQIIDYTGPYEVFGQSGFEVFTVAARPDAITTAMGMKVIPRFTLEDSPAPNVIVIPGGEVTATQNDPLAIKWIQERSVAAEHVLSVCNGAYILAKTGLLDGLAATTFYGLIDGLGAAAPKTRIVTDQRYVDNGKIITTAGISSGIDGSLYLVSKMMGKARAQMAALNMEYNWQPESKYARANLADRHLRKIFSRSLRFDVPEGSTLKVLNTDGGADAWEVSWQVQGPAAAADVMKQINNLLAAEGKWDRQDRDKTAGATKSLWRFVDEKGSAWSGEASVQPLTGEKNSLIAILKVNQDGRSTPSSIVKTKK